ncbi:MAG: NAD-binding protein [Deltaproteobacteria bacterium]|jgi:Trk K+ transport system NAD-binding subunit|nr:NAD-binding protein [Deltaproteobacteria bacterium]
MTELFSQMTRFARVESNKRNMLFMLRLLAFLAALVAVYTLLFHLIMQAEGQEYSPLTGLYWTFTVMTTLGFGDITFHSDLGKMFTVVVLLSGILLFMLVIPFTFIRFVYGPWLEAQIKIVVPRTVPASFSGHVIVAGADSIAMSLVDRLRQSGTPYALLVADAKLALSLFDLHYSVIEGDLDSRQTYEKLRVDDAAMVVALYGDLKNTSIAAKVREVSKSVPVLSAVHHEDSVDILRLAGCNHVYHFSRILGQAMAQRAFGLNMLTNTIGRFEHLCIAEAPALRTPYLGKTLRETDLRSHFALNVVGIWRGREYTPPLPDMMIEAEDMLLLAGTADCLDRFDRHAEAGMQKSEAAMLILGGGEVGRAVAQALEGRNIPFRLVEKNPADLPPDATEKYILGSAADRDILRKGGIETTHAVIVTTHDDDLNIYLTIYCRKLRPDVKIISRATFERNVPSLYSAGADLVLSSATLAANIITNVLTPGRVFALTEGLNVFRVRVPSMLVGVSLRDSHLRRDTKCNVVVVRSGESLCIPPDPVMPLRDGDELILIGAVEAEREFMAKYPT